MGDARAVLLVAVAAAVVLAGCSGGGGTTTPSATPAGTDPGETATPTGTPESTASTAPPTDTATATPTQDPGLEPDAVRSAALEAMASADAYRVRANVTSVLAGPVTREISQDIRTVVDRDAREFRRNVSATVMGRSSESSAYLVDRTLYLRSQAYVGQYSSEWIQLDVSGNFTQYWVSQDSLGQMRRVLANVSDVELTGTGRVDGTRTATLSLEVSPAEFRSILGNVTGTQLGSNLTVHRARYTLRVAVDDGRLLAASSQINSTVTVRGQSVRQNTTTTYRFGYDVSPSISLPEAAEDAVNVSEGSSGAPAPRLRGTDPGTAFRTAEGVSRHGAEP